MLCFVWSVDLGRPWRTHEAFQVILKEQVRALIKLGAQPQLLVRITGWVYFYLCRAGYVSDIHSWSSVGSCLALMFLSYELGELSQWQCYKNSTVNIVVAITITVRHCNTLLVLGNITSLIMIILGLFL